MFIPDEIVREILRHLTPRLLQECKLSRKALSHASRTCKRLRSIALPILYDTIQASPKLLLVLAENEELASLVKAIDLYHFIEEIKEDKSCLWKSLDIGRLSRLPHHVKLQLCAIIDMHYHQLGDKYQSRQYYTYRRRVEAEELDKFRFDWESAPQLVFLLLLPNLEHIANAGLFLATNDVSLDFLRQTGDFRAVSTDGNSVPGLYIPAPPRLRTLRWEVDRPARGDADCEIGWFAALILPTVRQIETSGMLWGGWGGLGGNDDIDERLPERLGLQQIECAVEPWCINEGLDDILRRCPDLQSLNICSSGTGEEDDEDDEDPEIIFDWTDVGNTFRQYGRGLVHLVLDLGGLDGLKNHERWTGGKMGSLRALGGLRSLVLSQDVMLALPTESYLDADKHPYDARRLTLDQCLPDSLEHITLLSAPEASSWNRRMTEEQIKIEGDAIHQQVYELLQAKGRQGNLRQLRMCWQGFQRETESLGFRTENKRVRSFYSEGSTRDGDLSVTDIVRIV